MNSSLELIEHRVDLRYGLIRYLAWLIPTIGFIGTVIGLGGSLALVPESGDLSIYTIAHALSPGFNCTLVALLESAIPVFVLYLGNQGIHAERPRQPFRPDQPARAAYGGLRAGLSIWARAFSG